MTTLASTLDAGPRYDDELTELESRWTELHDRYTLFSAEHRPRRDTLKDPPDDVQHLYAPPYPELLQTAREVREHRDSTLMHFAKLPQWPPPPRLLAETVLRDIHEAGVLGNDLETMRARLHHFQVRRRDVLEAHIAVIQSRFTRFARCWTDADRASGPLRVRLQALQKNLEATESRLRRLAPIQGNGAVSRPVAKASTGEDLFFSNQQYKESTLSCIFRADIMVCLQDVIMDDRLTRFLRRFLCRMEHLPLSHRDVILRLALELRSAADHIVAPGDWIPKKKVSRSKLEVVLQDLAREFGVRATLQADDGHTFAAITMVEFPKLFEAQEERWRFEAYPEDSIDASKDGRGLEPRSLRRAATPEVMVERLIGVGPSDEPGGLPSLSRSASRSTTDTFLKPCGWVPYVLLRPRVDPIPVEQRVLLVTSPPEPDSEADSRLNSLRRSTDRHRMKAGVYSSGQQRSVQTNTARGVEHVVAGERSSRSTEVSEDFDPLLQSEMESLGSGDADAATERINRTVTQVAKMQFDHEFAEHAAPEHLLRAYHVLRFVQVRGLRRRLLGLLNLFRFLQQRLAHDEAVRQFGPDAGSEQHQTSSTQTNVGEVLHSGSSPPTLPSFQSHHPSLLPGDTRRALLELSGVERLVNPGLTGGEDHLVVVDKTGLHIMHEVALHDLDCVEREMVRVGSHFIRKVRDNRLVQDDHMVDHVGVLKDLFVAEVEYHDAKWSLLEVYIEIYEQNVELLGRNALAQQMVDLMASRPHLDLETPYFLETFVGEAAALRDRARLLRVVFDHQVTVERKLAAETAARSSQFQPTEASSEQGQGEDPQLNLGSIFNYASQIPRLGNSGLAIRFLPLKSSENKPYDLLDVFPSVSLVWQVDKLIEDSWNHLTEFLIPVVRHRSEVVRACVATAMVEWKRALNQQPVHLIAPTESTGDVLGCENFDDPAWLALILEDAANELPSVFGVLGDWQTTGVDVPSDEHNPVPGPFKAKTALPCVEDDVEDPELVQCFAYLRDSPQDERILCLYLNLLDHVSVRQRLTDTILELRIVEDVLKAQSRFVGTEIQLHSEPLVEFAEKSTRDADGKASESTSTRKPCPRLLSTSDLDADFGDLDLSTPRSVVLHCCNTKLHEMKVLYQHELVNVRLGVLCAFYNTFVLDEAMRNQVSTEVIQTRSWKNIEDDSCLQLLREFRRTILSLDSEVFNPSEDTEVPTHRAPRAKAPATWLPSELSREMRMPTSAKVSSRSGIAAVLRDKNNELTLHIREAGLRRNDLLRRFKLRMISHYNMMLAEAACDLSVRVQAAKAAMDLRILVALVPSEFSLFKNSTPETPRSMVEGDGSISNIFHVPRAVDILMLRGTTVAPYDGVRAASESERKMPDIFEDNPASQLAMPRLDIEYSGPAYVALLVLQMLTPLVTIMFFWCSLKADRTVLLRLNHAVEKAHRGHQDAADASATVLAASMIASVQMEELEGRDKAPPDPVLETWSALQLLRVEFETVAQQLKSLKDGRTPAVLAFLRGRLQCAASRTALLLRQSLRSALDSPDHFWELRRWLQYVEGYAVDNSDRLLAIPYIGPSADGTEEALPRSVVLIQPSDCSERVPIVGNFDSSVEFRSWPPCPLPWLSPHFGVLLAMHTWCGCYGESPCLDKLGASTPLALYRRTMWQLPEPPLRALTRGMCLLPAAIRHSTADIGTRLEMKIEEFFQLREVSGVDASAVIAENELVGTLLTLDRLREAATCASMRTLPPTSIAEANRADAFWQQHLAPEQEETETAEAGEGSVRNRSTDPESLRIQTRDEIRSNYTLIGRLLGILKKVMVRVGIAALEKLCEGFSRTHCETVVRSRPVLSTAKAEALATFNRLRSRGSRVLTHGGGHAYVLREYDIDECVDELGRRLLRWKHAAIGNQLKLAKKTVATKLDELRCLEQGVLQNWWDATQRLADAEAQTVSAVADRSLVTLSEVDRLKTVLRDLSAAAFEAEYRLSAKIQHSVLTEISTLEQQLAEAKGRYSSYVGEMRTCIADSIAELKKDLLFSLQKLAPSNYALKQRTKALQEEWMLDSRQREAPGGSILRGEERHPIEVSKALRPRVDVVSVSGRCEPVRDIEGMHEEINELRQSHSRLHTHFRLRFSGLRQEFDQQIQAFSAVLSSNSDLWERVSEVRERERLTEDQLVKSKKRNTGAADAIDQLVKLSAHETDLAVKLEAWKIEAAKRQGELVQEAKKYERSETFDVKRLAFEIAKLDEEIRLLTRGRSENRDRDVLVKMQREREKRWHRRQRRLERQLTKKMQAKAELIRHEMECGHQAEEESAIALWVDEYEDLTLAIAAIDAENELLKPAGSTRVRKVVVPLSAEEVESAKKEDLRERSEMVEALCYSVRDFLPAREQRQIDQAMGRTPTGVLKDMSGRSSPSQPPRTAGRLGTDRPRSNSVRHLVGLGTPSSLGGSFAPGVRDFLASQPSAPGHGT